MWTLCDYCAGTVRLSRPPESQRVQALTLSIQPLWAWSARRLPLLFVF